MKPADGKPPYGGRGGYPGQPVKHGGSSNEHRSHGLIPAKGPPGLGPGGSSSASGGNSNSASGSGSAGNSGQMGSSSSAGGSGNSSSSSSAQNRLHSASVRLPKLPIDAVSVMIICCFDIG